jgi:hypothetical protein
VPDEEDRNGDIISAEEIIKTAHEFMANIWDKFLNIDHKDDSHIDNSMFIYVENFIAPNDIIVWDNVVKKWSWYVWIKFLDDDLYEDVKSGEFVWVSMEGYFLKD